MTHQIFHNIVCHFGVSAQVTPLLHLTTAAWRSTALVMTSSALSADLIRFVRHGQCLCLSCIEQSGAQTVTQLTMQACGEWFDYCLLRITQTPQMMYQKSFAFCHDAFSLSWIQQCCKSGLLPWVSCIITVGCVVVCCAYDQ